MQGPLEPHHSPLASLTILFLLWCNKSVILHLCNNTSPIVFPTPDLNPELCLLGSGFRNRAEFTGGYWCAGSLGVGGAHVAFSTSFIRHFLKYGGPKLGVAHFVNPEFSRLSGDVFQSPDNRESGVRRGSTHRPPR